MNTTRPFTLALAVLGCFLALALSACGDGASSGNPDPTFTIYGAAATLPAFPAATVIQGPPLTGAPSPVQSPTASPAPSMPPSATPVPATPTPQPSPTPLGVWIAPDVPESLAEALSEAVAAQPERYELASQAKDLQIGGHVGSTEVATWVYALVAPFPTLTDGLTWEELRGAWNGGDGGPLAGRALLMSESTLALLKDRLGEPAAGAVEVLPPGMLLERAWAGLGGVPPWAIIPFEALDPRWKVLRIDGRSPLDRDLDLAAYPLTATLSLAAPDDATAEQFLATANLPATNRDESRMTVLVMTGVTALTRATAWRMEGKGLTYPAQDIGDWLRQADITHVSNEVSFDPECGPPNPVQEGLLFCSDPRYIVLLEDIGVDVVEMTGNHIADAGPEHISPTLDMYVERGWQYFGGGRNLEDARQPAIVEHNGNRLAFLGCNPVGPPRVWATPEQAGAAPCDYDLLYTQLAQLRGQGILPIVTLQYWEEDRYDPTPQQIADFEGLAAAGAVIVSGSHAHHVQGFGFHEGHFIHYGIGNLFFDQMEIMGNRQEFIDRHIFYEGRHISTELLTALLEDWSRPRPMTDQERQTLLQTVFAVSVWE